MLFEIQAGVPDREISNSQYWSEKQTDAVKFTYKIITEIFYASKDADLRVKAVESGLIDKILLRLKMVTGEVERKYADDGVKVQNLETEEKLEVNQPSLMRRNKWKGVGHTARVSKTFTAKAFVVTPKMTKNFIIFRGGYDKGYKNFIADEILFVRILIYLFVS